MNMLWKKYLETMAKELGEIEAARFVESVRKGSQNSVEKAETFFYRLGKIWAPTVHFWGSWTRDRAKYSTIALILRDAKPLGELPLAKDWKKLFLNRKNCGISDELSGDITQTCDPLLARYIASKGCENEFTFVDSGCYGTIVRELHEFGFSFQPLFFFSKNPHIRGFLNDLGVKQKEGEILNDSLECAFPNIHMRPQKIVKRNGRVFAPLLRNDPLSVRFGNASLRGVRDYASREKTNPEKEVCKLLLLSERARTGEFTGVLPFSSPEWSGKDEFLARWPPHLSWI